MAAPDGLTRNLRELFGRVKRLETSPQSGLWRRKTNAVATSQSTTSTAYVDLATVGPTVTVDVPASGTVLVGVGAYIGGTLDIGIMSFVGSGANTIAAADSRAARMSGAVADVMKWVLLTGLAQGNTVLTAKYRSAGGASVVFVDRSIIAIPI